MKLYFAYGSNINQEQMRRRCPHSRLVGIGVLDNYKLTFYSHANIEYSVGDKVYGVLVELDERDEPRLDLYEGYPSYYKKMNISIGGKEAFAYVMSESYMDPYAKSAKTYVRGIYDGYKDVSLASLWEPTINFLKALADSDAITYSTLGALVYDSIETCLYDSVLDDAVSKFILPPLVEVVESIYDKAISTGLFQDKLDLLNYHKETISKLLLEEEERNNYVEQINYIRFLIEHDGFVA